MMPLAFKLMAFCDCDNMNHNLIMGNVGTWDYGAYINSMSESDGCPKEFGDRTSDPQVQNAQGALIGGSTFLNTLFLQGIVDLQQVSDYLYAIGETGNSTVLYIKLSLDQQNWCQNPPLAVERNVTLTIYHCGGVTLDNQIFCSGKAYLFEDLVNYPAAHYDRSVNFSTGDQFSNLVVTLQQPINNTVGVTYNASISGYIVRRYWSKSIFEVPHPDFTSIPENITVNSPDQVLGLYSFWDIGTIPEFNGNGVYNQGGTWYFSPNLAGINTHVIALRANNQGCISNWVDTIFYVTPIASVASAPSVNLPFTFGAGETGCVVERVFPGMWVGVFPNTTYLPGGTSTLGNYHIVCSGKDYTLSVLNPNVNLQYEWKSIYNGSLVNEGFGTTKLFSMPTTNEIDLNIIQGGNSAVFPSSDIPFYLSMGSRKTVHTGDLFSVYVRSINVNSDTSSWRKVYLGVSPTPEINTEFSMCYDNDPDLYVGSLTPLYDNNLSFSGVRTSRWDIDGDNTWEIYGDTVSYLMSNTNKVNNFKAQLFDTTKFWAWNASTGYQEFTYAPADQVCYSEILWVPVVRNPQPIVTWNEAGTIVIGSSIYGSVSGVYFNPLTDSLIWNFTDGSGTYSGEDIWHYLNDLGSIGCDFRVIDTFGCSTTLAFPNWWFVPGTLGDDELSLDGTVYPNPASESVNLSCWKADHVVVYGISGIVIEEFDVINDVVDCSNWGENTVVLYNANRNKYVKLILRKK